MYQEFGSYFTKFNVFYWFNTVKVSLSDLETAPLKIVDVFIFLFFYGIFFIGFWTELQQNPQVVFIDFAVV